MELEGSTFVRRPYFADMPLGQNYVLHGRGFGQNRSVTRNAGGYRFVQCRTSLPCTLDKKTYIVDACAGQKSSTQSYPQPLPWALSAPYFMASWAYNIPSEPYIVPSMPYIVAKSID